MSADRSSTWKESIDLQTSSTKDAHYYPSLFVDKYLNIKTEVFNKEVPIIADGYSYVHSQSFTPHHFAWYHPPLTKKPWCCMSNLPINIRKHDFLMISFFNFDGFLKIV